MAMLRSGSTWRWRRLASTLILLCLCLSRVEALVPEVHHGDPASSVASSQQALPDEPGGGHAPAPSQTGGDGHRFHLDHCAHSHLAALRADSGPTDPSSAFHRALGEPRGLHESIVLAPEQRPPIA